MIIVSLLSLKIFIFFPKLLSLGNNFIEFLDRIISRSCSVLNIHTNAHAL